MSKNPGVYTALQSAVKNFEPNLVIFFVYFENSSFDYLWNFFVCYGSKRETILLATYASLA